MPKFSFFQMTVYEAIWVFEKKSFVKNSIFGYEFKTEELYCHKLVTRRFFSTVLYEWLFPVSRTFSWRKVEFFDQI